MTSMFYDYLENKEDYSWILIGSSFITVVSPREIEFSSSQSAGNSSVFCVFDLCGISICLNSVLSSYNGNTFKNIPEWFQSHEYRKEQQGTF